MRDAGGANRGDAEGAEETRRRPTAGERGGSRGLFALALRGCRGRAEGL
jgi:hypothetical protein